MYMYIYIYKYIISRLDLYLSLTVYSQRTQKDGRFAFLKTRLHHQQLELLDNGGKHSKQWTCRLWDIN